MAATIGALEIVLRADIARLQRDMDSARRVVGDATAGISRAADMAKVALASIGIGAGMQQIIQMADAYTKFTAQLKLATQSAREYGIAYADVKRIAMSAQADLGATGVLYARIANGTRELGIAQSQVAKVTETVNMALKVSGATTEESASAMLQLSQAFASGTLRGEEFNAVNEAAPRLMLALADGMGVPVGALKQMATEGKITSQIMADVLPKALDKLREEAKQVQTIGGAFTVLKNEMMELVGTQAQASGAVSVLVSGIDVLSKNLAFLAGTIGILIALKTVSWLATVATQTYATVTATYAGVTANGALLTSNLAAAESNAAAASAAYVTATARVAELRAAVLASEGNVALALTLNGLIPAEANAARAASVLATANTALTAATSAATVAARAFGAVMAFLTGPVGVILTLLGTAATAWYFWGKSAEDANKQAKVSTEASSEEILGALDKQIEKLHERNNIAKLGLPTTKQDSPANAQLGKIVADMARAQSATGEYANKTLDERKKIVADLGVQYEKYTKKITALNDEIKVRDDIKNKKSTGEWMAEYATKAEQLAAKLKLVSASYSDGIIPAELEARIRKSFEEKDKGATKAAAATKREQTAYESLMTTISEKIAAGKLELMGYDQLSESQKLTIKLDEAVKSGKKELTPAHIANAKAMIAERAALERLNEENKFYIEQSKERFDASSALIKFATEEADKQEDLVKTFGMTKSAIELLEVARLEEQLAQAGGIAACTEETAKLEALIDAKKRSAAASGALEGLEATKKANEEFTADWKKSIEKYDDIFRQGFADMVNNGKGAWKSFTKSLVTTFKTSVADQIYKMFAQPFVVKFVASLLGIVGGSTASGVASAATGSSGIGDTVSMVSGIKNAYSAITNGFSGLSTSVAGGVQAGMNALGFGGSSIGSLSGNAVGGFSATAGAPGAFTGAGTIGFTGTGGAGAAAAPTGAFAQGVGTAAGYAGGMAAGKMIGSAISGQYSIGGHGSAVVNVSTVIGAVLGGPIGGAIGGAVGGLLNRAFGMGPKKITSQGLRGTLADSGAIGESYANWKKDGGWFRSDKKDTDKTPFSQELIDQFSSGFSGLKTVSLDFAKSLGLSADALKDYSKTFDITLTADAAKNQEAIAKFFTDLGDEIATKLAPNIADFARNGELSSATLQRLSTSLSAVNGMFDTLNVKLYDVSLAGGDMASKLVDLFGSLEAMQKVSGDYFSQYYSEQEKVDIATRQLSKTFADLGFAMPAATEAGKAQLRAQIESALALGEAGQKEAAQLMGLSGALSQLTEATTATTAAAKQAADQALSDAKSQTDAALQAVHRAIDAEKKRIGVIRDVAAESVSAISGVFDLLKEQISQLYGTVSSTSAMQAAQGNAFIDQALQAAQSTGYMPDAQELANAIAAARGGLSADQFATQFEADKAALVMAGKLSQLRDVSGYQLTAAEKALQVANDQLSALDAQLEYAQQQVDLLNGINTSILSLKDALAALASAKVSAVSAQRAAAPYQAPPTSGSGAGGSVTVSDLYTQALGRAPDAEGLAFWTSAFGSSVSSSEAASFFDSAKTVISQQQAAGTWDAFQEKYYPSFDVGINRVPYDMTARIHADEAIVPAAFNPFNPNARTASGSGNTERLERLVETLTAQNQRLEERLAVIAENTRQLADQFDNVTEGGNMMRSEVMA